MLFLSIAQKSGKFSFTIFDLAKCDREKGNHWFPIFHATKKDFLPRRGRVGSCNVTQTLTRPRSKARSLMNHQEIRTNDRHIGGEQTCPRLLLFIHNVLSFIVEWFRGDWIVSRLAFTSICRKPSTVPTAVTLPLHDDSVYFRTRPRKMYVPAKLLSRAHARDVAFASENIYHRIHCWRLSHGIVCAKSTVCSSTQI